MSNAEAYITLFFQDLEQLNVCLGIYLNVIIPIKDKFKALSDKQFFEELEENDVKSLEEITKEIRYNSVRINTKLQALQAAFSNLKTDEKGTKKLEEAYTHITSKRIPDYKVVSDYIIELNKLFVHGVGNQLLVKSQQYYESLSQTNNVSGYDYGQEKQ